MSDVVTGESTQGGASVTSEAQALADLVAWSGDCPPWQRDALRRLCRKDQLDEDDYRELLDLCKGEAGEPNPLTLDHVRDPAASTAVVTLRNIHDVANVNALAPGERLSFGKIGITVVYGDNGSGKSGYARILKQVCRARSPKDDRILPNIYAGRGRSPSAVVDFTADGQNRSAEWTAGQPVDALLSSASVFDSRTANVHVDQTNDVAYTPLPLKILGQLVEACREIKKRLTAEVRALEKQTPASIRNPECHESTAVGQLIAQLSAQPQSKDVERLATLDAEETRRLEELRADINRDPARAARQLDTLRSKLQGHADALRQLSQAITDEQWTHLRGRYRDYCTARQAAAAAADVLFADEPLPDIGSATWRALWEAARDYSTREAYRDEPFPFTGDGARCVLCQQELGEDAAARLSRFEQFVTDETKRKEQEARDAYESARAAFVKANIRVPDIRMLHALLVDERGDEVSAAQIRRQTIIAKWRLRAILRHHKTESAAALPAFAPIDTAPVDDHVSALNHRAEALRGEEQSEERRQMQAAFHELADRAWLAIVKDDVLAEIARKKEIDELNAAAKNTATNRISSKSTEVAEHLVTNALRAQFTKEVDRLGVSALAIELRQERTSYGVPLFRVSLIQKPDARVGEVLSEGEHRCVALAAFLAELATTDGESAIVFDDPVSSLDHMHREAVAGRLVDESLKRQIVVFTHDIAFLFLLDQACREKGAQIGFRCVTRTRDHAGFCQQDPPARAQPVEQVIQAMQNQLENERIRYDRGDHEGWERTLDALAKRLRWTWERAVEEAVGPVIKRLSNKVQTAGLGKVTTITLDDCQTMREAYGRCSALLHSSSEALNAPLPGPDAVQTEISVLRDWVADIKSRQQAIEWMP